MATKYERTRLQGVYTYTMHERRFQGAPDVTYVISYKKPDGKKVWEKVGLKSEGYTLQMAAEVRAERMRTMRHGEEVKTAREIQQAKLVHDRTLAEIAKAYWESDRGRNLKGKVTDENRWEKHIEPLLGKKRISELTALDVQRIKRDLADKAPATTWNVLELLRRLANFGVKHGLSPALGFRIEMPHRDNEKVEFLTDDEAARLVKVLDEWGAQDVARMVKVALLTGLRRGELFKLQDQDVDREHALIRLRSPKGKRTVSIPLSPPVAELLQEQAAWRARQKDPRRRESPFVFPGRNGEQRVDCGAVDRIKAEAKLPKHFRPFHGLRHHFAVSLANSGEVSLDMIGELLTHKSLAMTRRYGQFLPETKRKASELAASLIMGKANGNGKAAAEPEAEPEQKRTQEPEQEPANVLPLRRTRKKA